LIARQKNRKLLKLVQQPSLKNCLQDFEENKYLETDDRLSINLSTDEFNG
jgi:hypothetical protein